MRCPTCGDDDNDGPGPCSCGKIGKVSLSEAKPKPRMHDLRLTSEEVGMAQFCVAAIDQNMFASRGGIPKEVFNRKKDLLVRLGIKLRRC